MLVLTLRGVQICRAVGPETATRGEERLIWVKAPADDISAPAVEHRAPHALPDRQTFGIPAAQGVFRDDKILGKSPDQIIGIALADCSDKNRRSVFQDVKFAAGMPLLRESS